MEISFESVLFWGSDSQQIAHWGSKSPIVDVFPMCCNILDTALSDVTCCRFDEQMTVKLGKKSQSTIDPF